METSSLYEVPRKLLLLVDCPVPSFKKRQAAPQKKVKPASAHQVGRHTHTHREFIYWYDLAVYDMYIYIYKTISIYTCISARRYVHTYIYIYVICICTCTCIYTYLFVYLLTYPAHISPHMRCISNLQMMQVHIGHSLQSPLAQTMLAVALCAFAQIFFYRTFYRTLIWNPGPVTLSQ